MLKIAWLGPNKQTHKPGVLAIFALCVVLAAILQTNLYASIGISGGPINSIAASYDNTTTSVYVGTGVGVFKSENGQDIWTPVNDGLSSLYVYDLVVDPDTPTLIYAATEGGVFKTTDGGQKWSAAGLKGSQTYCLAIHPVTTTSLVAGTPEGVYTSINSGAVFTKDPAGPLYVYSVAVSSDNDSTLYAGSFGEGVHKSTDFGVTWSKTGSGPEKVNHITINPSDSQIVYAGTQSGVYKTTGGGTSWSLVSTGFSDIPVYSIAIQTSSPSTLYSATDNGVYKTTNAGSSWTSVNSGIATDDIQGPFVRQIVIDPQDVSTLYAGTYSGNIYDVDIYKSTNSGSSWTQINRELSNTSVYSLAFDAADPSMMFAGTSTIGVLKSTNSGLSWQEATEGLTNYLVRTVVVNPDSSDVYAGTASGLFLSSDAGETWEASSPSHEIYTIAVDPFTPENIFMGTNSGVFLSTDDGGSWSSLNNNLKNPNIYCIVFHPGKADTVFVGTKGGGVFKSTSGGENWVSANDGLDYLEVLTLAIDPVSPFALYAGTEGGGIFKSSDTGEFWQVASPGLNGFTINSIAINPDDTDMLFAGITNNGLYKSTNAGQTWESADEDLSGKTVYNVALDPEDSQTVFVTVHGDIIIYTFNTPPDKPASPSPPDGAVNQPVETNLTWTSTDPDAGDSLVYKVYFGTDTNPDTNPPVDVSSAEYSPGPLQLSQTYTWKVVAIDSHNAETEGDPWKFSTSISNPPLKPSAPSPGDGAEDQPVTITLSWKGGDTDNADIVTYDIYFGTKNTPPLAKEALEEPAYSPSRILRPRTTYYWKIVSRDNHGLETEGDTWSFTTGFLPEQCVIETIVGADQAKLQTLRQFRDELLLKTETGKKLVVLYYKLSPEILLLFNQDARLKAETVKLFNELYPTIKTCLQMDACQLLPTEFLRILNLIDMYAAQTCPATGKLLLMTKNLIIF